MPVRSLAIGFITVVGHGARLLLPEDFLGNFNNFLLVVLYFMIPWTAVNLVDFFFVRKSTTRSASSSSRTASTARGGGAGSSRTSSGSR